MLMSGKITDQMVLYRRKLEYQLSCIGYSSYDISIVKADWKLDNK